MNEWNQTRANVVWLVCLNWATFAARLLIYWLKIITYCTFKCLLICIFSYTFYCNYLLRKEAKRCISTKKTRDNWWCKNSVISYYAATPHYGPLPPTLIVFINTFVVDNSIPSICLQVSSPGRSGGRAGKRTRAYNYAFGIWIPPPISLWLPVDYVVRFPPISVKRKRARM